MHPLITFRAVTPHLFFGLDLGQRQDHSAFAILERLQEPLGRSDPVTFAPYFRLRFILRHVERFRLGTAYLEVIRRLARLISRDHELDPTFHRTLVVDASGVGAPIVELLRAAQLPAALVPLIITAAGQPHDGRVSRADLVTNLRVLLESGLLRVPPGVHDLAALTAELLTLSTVSGAAHDDLAIAVALAAWQAAATLPTRLKRDDLLCLT